MSTHTAFRVHWNSLVQELRENGLSEKATEQIAHIEAMFVASEELPAGPHGRQITMGEHLTVMSGQIEAIQERDTVVALFTSLARINPPPPPEWVEDNKEALTKSGLLPLVAPSQLDNYLSERRRTYVWWQGLSRERKLRLFKTYYPDIPKPMIVPMQMRHFIFMKENPPDRTTAALIDSRRKALAWWRGMPETEHERLMKKHEPELSAWPRIAASTRMILSIFMKETQHDSGTASSVQ